MQTWEPAWRDTEVHSVRFLVINNASRQRYHITDVKTHVLGTSLCQPARDMHAVYPGVLVVRCAHAHVEDCRQLERIPARGDLRKVQADHLSFTPRSEYSRHQET